MSSSAGHESPDPGLLQTAVLRPIAGQHAFEACVEQLGTAIRLGVYPVGSALPPERELAERMSVSRATLREAMAALRQAGLVQTTRGRHGGTVVTLKPSRPRTRKKPAALSSVRRQDWIDALDFRRIVEPGASGLAAARPLDPHERGLLDAAHGAVASARGAAAHRQADSRFHLTIAALTRSPRTVEAVTTSQAALHEMLSAIPVLTANIDHSDRQHARITTAILAGDVARARRVMEQHCDDTAALLRGLIG